MWQRTSRQSIVSGLGLKVSDLGFSVQGPTTAAGNSTSVSGNLWCAINAIFRGSVTCSLSEMPTTAILSVTKQVILDPFTLVAVSPSMLCRSYSGPRPKIALCNPYIPALLRSL